ncbi:hypothetical protein [Aureispira anguillae]|uniref:Uncharacterized protein n=1 Tax=Aureispira anguillae TaxID=2864201 RepID=A0A916DTV8_9BACT|nr:hypothetical protein [Aureispira anguillae]BDS12100.1 hypothetical protein AsAng_0028150 [Aureispira anguillae]
MSLFYAVLSLVINLVIILAFMLIIRKLTLWYWQIDRLVKGIEDMNELALLVLQKDLEEKKVTVINIPTNREVELTIKEYLNHPNKKSYKLK